MEHISLFSGIGGFDLALERAGMKCVSLCEIDKNAQSVLRRHFPNVELFDDVRKVGIATHGRKSIDLICGGFPCQDLSVAGKREGLAGERSGLWFEFARIIDELEPQWVVIENVPGLLSSDKGRDFAIIIQWLAKRGYGVAWRVLDAQYFGVAQRRRRVFIVGSFGDGRAAEVLFERESGKWDTPPSREAGKDVAGTLKGGSGKRGYPDPSDGNGGGLTVAPSIVSNGDAHSGFRDEKGLMVAYNIQQNDGGNHKRKDRPNGGMYVNETDKALTIGGTDQTLSVQRTVGALQSRDSKGIGTTIDDKIVWEMQHASEAYRETGGGVAPTLQSRMGTGGNNVPLVGVRRLTPTECERLQGFPDGWTDGQSDSARYRQLGNAVAVPVVEWIAKRIVALHDESHLL